MKKSTLKLAALSLMMTAMLFNCKDDDKTTDPTEPSTDISNQIKALELPAFTPTVATVPSTPGAIVPSAKTSTLVTDLSAMSTTGTVPTSVIEANASLTSALSASELAALSSVSPEAIEAMKTSGTIPAELKAIVDKAYANATLAAYLPSVTAPKVNGVAVTAPAAARIGGTEAVEKTEEVLVDDACVAQATALFNAAKAKLDASRASQEAQVATAYAAAIAGVAAGQTACGTTATTNAATARTAAATFLTQLLNFATTNQAALGDNYVGLVEQGYLYYIAAIGAANQLEILDKQACANIAAATPAAATATQTADLATIKVNYDAKIAEATRLRIAAAESCHNQGGGN
jgi:hypothetical protein